MKRTLILTILFLLAAPAVVFAQPSVPGVRYVSVAPTGSCSQSPPVQVLNSSGAIYTCNNGTWAVQGGGGGSGTVTDGAGTTTTGLVPFSTTTAHVLTYSNLSVDVTGNILTIPGAAYIGTPSTAAKAALPSGAHGFAGDEVSVQFVPAAGVDGCQYDNITHTMLCSQNGSAPLNPLLVTVVETAGSPATLTATTGFYWNNTAGAYSFDLATPILGEQQCFGQYQGRNGALSLIPPSGTTIYYEGVAGTAGSATGLVSSGVIGDFVCLVATSTTTYQAIGAGYGTWTNH